MRSQLAYPVIFDKAKPNQANAHADEAFANRIQSMQERQGSAQAPAMTS